MTPASARDAIRFACKMLAPPLQIRVSDHADRFRVVSAGHAPGRWRTSLVPHTREIMDVMDDPRYPEVTIKKASRMSGSECVLNYFNYKIDIDPTNILYVLPDLGVAETYSKETLKDFIRDNYRIRNKISEERKITKGVSTSTTLTKYFPGGLLAIVGAESTSAFRGTARKIIILDDKDDFPKTLGVEGDPSMLAEGRSETFSDSKIINISTPTDIHSAIHSDFLRSDQRYFNIPCPHCGYYQRLLWERLRWVEPNRPDLIYFECESCNREIRNHHKATMFNSGKWIPTHPEVIGHAGFQIPKFISNFIPWQRIVKKYVRSKDDPNKLRIFYNTDLGEIYTDIVAERREDTILKLRDSRPRGLVPDDIACIFGIFDMQKRGFYFEIRAFRAGPLLESFQIKEGFVDSWQAVEDLVYREVYRDAAGNEHKVTHAAIDTGGGRSDSGSSRTKEAYDFVATHRGFRAFKGADSSRMTQLHRITNLSHYPASNKAIPGGLQLHIINVSLFKNDFARRLSIKPDDPGAWHLHSECGEDYARQLCSETRDTQGNWVNPGNKANHFFDIGTYALALADIIRLSQWPTRKAGEVKEPPKPTGRRVISKGVGA